MRLGILLSLVILLSLGSIALRSSAFQSAAEDEELIDRGRYLAEVAGACIDCHTPHINGEPDRTRLFAGHPEGARAPRWSPELSESGIGTVVSPLGTAFAGPWGVSFASNLTPDLHTGLGGWNESLFIRTMRRGDFQAPMPIHLKNISRSDLKAIWAYLTTLEGIYNGVPESRVTPPQE